MAIANKSSNKVRVSKGKGSGAIFGLMDPAVNLRVQHGIQTKWIKSLDSGNFQVGLALTSGGTVTAKAYPHELTADLVDASGFGWPTASTVVLFGHHGSFPSGVNFQINSSGMDFLTGNQTVIFSRP